MLQMLLRRQYGMVLKLQILEIKGLGFYFLIIKMQ